MLARKSFKLSEYTRTFPVGAVSKQFVRLERIVIEQIFRFVALKQIVL